MGRIASNRKTTEALRKTLQTLESDPSVDSQDPAFVSLKCALLQRMLDLEVASACVQSAIHLVESQAEEFPESIEVESDSQSAIA